MIREQVVAIATQVGRSAGELRVSEGDPEREVALAAMRAAKDCWLAPTEDEAFIAGVAALTEVLPGRRDLILAEARAIGDRTMILGALSEGVPVDATVRWLGDEVSHAEDALNASLPEGWYAKASYDGSGGTASPRKEARS